MGLKRTKLLGIQAVTGINTVGILTVGTTPTAGGVGVASTTYLRGVVMHNTGLATATSSLYVYPSGVSDVSVGQTAYRLARVDLASNETFFFEMNYPLGFGKPREDCCRSYATSNISWRSRYWKCD